MKAILKKRNALDIAVLLIMTIGILTRAILINKVPGGMNQDEAFGAYEAYSLLHYGLDSSGFSFPVYLNTWGSGMSALNSYLMMPFMFVFGAQMWVARIPQLVTSILSLWVFYKLFCRLFNQKAGVIALLYLTICPYHVMMGRWSIDCNLAPAFLLFGLYFFVLGVDESKYYIASALCYVGVLYSYATLWPILPFIIFFQFLYVMYTKRFKLDKHVIGFVLIVGIMAIPLMLFLLVNMGYLDTIHLGRITIPKMTMMRESDISFSHKRDNFRIMIDMLINQNDWLIWNSTEEFGIYYKGFLIFGLVGLFYGIYRGIKSVVKREYDAFVLLFFQFICAFVLSTLIEVNVNRINCIHIPIIACIATGIYLIVSLIEKKVKFILPMVVIILLLLFVHFEIFYFSTYRDQIGARWNAGLESAVDYAKKVASDDETIFVEHSIYYPKILFFSETPVKEYINTVKYNNYPDTFLDVDSFGRYVFNNIDGVVPGNVCIIKEDRIQEFKERGFTIQKFSNVAVAY